MTAASPPSLTRRKALAAAGTVGIALLGAGFGRLVTTANDQPDLRLDLRFDRDPAPDPTAPETDVSTPTPTPTPATTPAPTPAAGAGDGGTDRRRTGDGTPFARSDVPSPVRRPTDGGTGGSTGPGGIGGGAVEPVDGPSAVVSTPALTLDGVVPGDGGTLTATLTVADAPAGLWLRSRVDDDENGRVEPETTAGDDDEAGELADAVAVTLWLDADGDGLPDEDVLYEGPLSGLESLANGVAVAACLRPGTHLVRLRWSLPTTATNEVQTDAAAFGIDFAATACDGTNPFA